MANLVYLSLGTNLGNRRQNLQHAVNALGELAAIEAISPVYETTPWGVADQPDFLNICLKGRTLLEPSPFLASCQAIEHRIGRIRVEKWGPRLIDIDLILFNDWVQDDETISIPHPQLDQRAFVLVPLFDIEPNLIEPRSGRSLVELVASIDRSTVERLNGSDGRLLTPTELAWGVKTYVMGIVNVTPDSFSGDGLFNHDKHISKIVELGKEFADAGADLLDVGGESTRPGNEPISIDEELARIIPAIKALTEYVDIPISVDTYKSSVARAGLEAGARWVNDVWGLRMDPEMAAVVGDAGCPVILMHNRSKPKDVSQKERLGGRYTGVKYENLIEDIRSEIEELVGDAMSRGVRREQIVVDPGIGFGKTVSQNLRILDELDRIIELGYPVLVGPSRKSFIGYSLNLPPDQRVEGTAAAVTIAIDRGADIIRVHDVESMVRVARMSDFIVRS